MSRADSVRAASRRVRRNGVEKMARHRQPTNPDWELTRLKIATFAVAGLLLLGVILAVTSGGDDQTLDSDPVHPTGSSTAAPTTTPPTTTTPPAVTTTEDTEPPATQDPPAGQPPGAAAVGAPCDNPGGFAVTADLRPVVCSASAGGTTWQPVI
jgi:hypothetical protein